MSDMFLFYEGDDPSKFDDLTGTNLNKQARYLNEEKIGKTEAENTYVSKDSVVDDLNSQSSEAPLSAKMGNKLFTEKLGVNDTAKSAEKLEALIKLILSSDSVIGEVSFDGSENIELPLNFRVDSLTNAILTKFRTSLVGGLSSKSFLRLGRSITDTAISKVDGPSIIIGVIDSHAVISFNPTTSEVLVSAGRADSLNWTKSLAFKDGDIAGKSGSSDKLSSKVIIHLLGDLEGSMEFDGSEIDPIDVNITINRATETEYGITKVVNDLSSTEETLALSAAKGKELSDLVKTKLSVLAKSKVSSTFEVTNLTTTSLSIDKLSSGKFLVTSDNPLGDNYVVLVESEGSVEGSLLHPVIDNKTENSFIVTFPSILVEGSVSNMDQKSFIITIV